MRLDRFKSVFLFCVAILLCGFAGRASAQQSNHLKYVDPFIGTTVSNVVTKWGNIGGTYPGAAAPSGNIQLSPETRVTGARGYNYADSSIYYFSCFKHASGYPEGSSGRFFIMPIGDRVEFGAGKYSARFSHGNEKASAGYYKVHFERENITTEATATPRTGMFRFTFAPGSQPRIFIGDCGDLTTSSSKIIHASNNHSVLNFSESFVDKKQLDGGWVFTFLPAQKNIIVKISTSSVSYAGAQNNIDKEIGRLDFDRVRQQTSQAWQKLLAVVDVSDSNEQNKTVFYTALYHSLLLPWVLNDADGRYTGVDGLIHQKTGDVQYDFFSPWDTFRSLHPLLTLLYPQKQKDVILSMLDVYKQSGYLPTESMTGNHAIPIIVDSYLKGITGFDKALVYRAMKKSIVGGPFVQNDMEVYNQKGYIPYTSPESVTRTVEYAYDDWALSQFAGQVMHNAADEQLLSKRAYNYRNLLNTNELLMLPRNGDDFKLQPSTSGYKEGDKWVYSYFVPQNGLDLVNMMGGDNQFATRLDSLLTNNVVLFDNETVFHLPYLFNQAGKPQLTQKWVRQIMLNRFSASPGGLPGNDDLGSTSSWYVFSGMGIYPVCPGRPLYAIGAPLFKSVTLHLPNGKTFVINSNNSSAKSNYVQGLKVNGKPFEKLVVPHALLVKGGSMSFNMGHDRSDWPLNKTPIELSATQQSARFKIANVSSTKKVVNPDEPLWVKFTLSNSGSTGIKTVKLIANSKSYCTKNCLVETGHTVNDSIPIRLYPAGETVLSIDGSAPVVVEVKLPARLQHHPYKIWNLDVKPMVKLNEKQGIKYTIKNTGGVAKVFDIPVKLNDTIVFADKIKLNAGQTRTINHTMAAAGKGFKKLKVDTASAIYKVYNSNLESLILDVDINGTTVSDKSGFNSNAIIIGNTAQEKLLFGDYTYVEMPNTPVLDRMGETITMMGWVYPTGKEKGLVDMITKGDNHVLQTMDNKTLTFFAGGWGRGDVTVNVPANWTNHWHHVAGVCTGNGLYLYIDGVLAGTAALDVTVNLSVNNKWVLGRNEEFPSERVFHGYINEVKVFESALSANEIQLIVKSAQYQFKN
ncbi:GH92 family glycosyl hydrolase [Mucilaginibacter dorajii]|uniref:LamG-like jellyroll fold domain-containing protein n=1 Tax=Mucilaginibacter dorajii TaxID=692994 RepID=A0ABP7QIJ7_9SPHI|nr:GH92 family glycosyl hydrolase [Mucilaginibacter dorajii]MCS3734292.1 putative alpha-1,2-mannosidase [Mucilaginibacter dorajii]